MNNKLSCCPALPRPPTSCLFAVALLTLLGLARAPLASAGDAPGWMHALTSAPLPPHDEKTDAVLLYDEEILVVQPNGKLKEIDRSAYKILRPDGRHYGHVIRTFDSETRITDIRGWCIPAQGKDFEVKDKDVTEKDYAEQGILVSHYRSKLMDIPAAEPGNIVGFEIEHEDRPYVLQDFWSFQSFIPVAESRYTLQLPQGWEYKTIWVNHAEIAPASIGNNQWQWVVKNVPEIKREEWMPHFLGVSAFMIVNLFPPGGASHGFLSWSEMGSWESQLLQGRLTASPEIKQKVAELTANSPSPDAKMRALAAFLQKDIRYVGIEVGIVGGWQPHAAPATFTSRYGDCKDKAALLAAMLHEIAIDSYLLFINTGRGSITPSTPPLLGFDHTIIAIRIPDSVVDPSLLATFNHPKLGRLLIFDPTDEITPFGELRGELQASYALLVTSDSGELIQVPQLPTSFSGVTRAGQFTLDAHGTLVGSVHEIRVGDEAMYQRMELRHVEKDADRIKPVELLMSHSMGEFQITKASVSNLNQNTLPFGFDWSFGALDYAKTAGDLLLVRPRVVGTKALGILETKEPRRYPIEFPGPRRDTDTFEIKIPAGYVIDELPPPTDVDYGFGSYHSKTEAKGDTIVYTRTFEIKELSVPVSKADDLKKFYRMIASDERNTAVLKKPAAH